MKKHALFALVLAGCSGSVDSGDVTGAGGGGPSGMAGRGSGGAGGGSMSAAGGSMAANGGTSAGGTGGTVMPPDEHKGPVTCNKDSDKPGPRRLWRLSGEQYKNTLHVAFNGGPFPAGQKRPDLAFLRSSPFDLVAAGDRFSTNSASYNMNDAEFRKLFDQTEETAAELVKKLRASGSCLALKKPFAECAREIVKERGRLLYQRPLTEAELTQVTNVATGALTALGGNENEAMAAALQALLMSPHFVYRTEVGAGAPDARGVVSLTSHEVAAALAYSLTDNPPDAELSNAADDGALTNPAQAAAHARRLLSKAADLGPMRTFFREFFPYTKAISIFKEPKLFPAHNPSKLVDDTDRFISEVVREAGGKDFLKTLLTTGDGYLQIGTYQSYNHPTKPELGPGGTDRLLYKVTYPAGQRAGILTQPSLLVAFSQPERTDPVQRGRFVAESLLCMHVPELPIEQVPDLTNLDPKATMRQRLAAHTEDPKCAACHKLMDPIGLGFEAYDHFGRFRTTESDRPVDTSGRLVGGGDAPFNGAIELASKLASMPQVEECFVRHSLRFWLGRPERESDGCAIKEAHDRYRRGGSLLAMVESLVSSPTFLQRTATSK